MKENPDRKKNSVLKNANSALQQLRTDFQSMMGKKRLNALPLVCIYREIFPDYDKTIDVYTSEYSRRMLLINLLSEN